MEIQVNTDSNIEGDEALIAHVKSVIDHTMDRFRDRITRVEVHLSDQNSHKGGSDDKRCVMEARLAGRQPTAVSHDGPTVALAVDGAAGKLRRMLERTLGRLQQS